MSLRRPYRAARTALIGRWLVTVAQAEADLRPELEPVGSSYTAVGGPSQVLSESWRPCDFPSPTQAT
jgi:hypothetical protein